jgi:Zn ribbon nucleic-acid-binding protein
MNILDTMQTITKLAKAGMTIELQEKIVELREEVLELKEENLRLREECLQAKQELERFTKGDLCPKCKKPAWSLQSSRPHPTLGRVGVLEKTFTCGECGYSEARMDKGQVVHDGPH